MKKILNDLLFIIPVMFYYVLEAFIVGMVITILWKIFFRSLICDLTYLQIVAGYWILKIVLFDVFKLISGLKQTKNDDNYDPDNINYNENITP